MQVYLLPISNQAQRLSISTSFQNRAALMSLKSGDYVVLSGKASDSDLDGVLDEVRVDAIESVGLHDLLGTWRSSKWQVLRFENFNRVTVYRPKVREFGPGSSRINLAKFKDLSYSLAPEHGTAYSIFLVEKQPESTERAAVFVGRIQLKKAKGQSAQQLLTFEIFDPKTGKTTESLSLSHVRD